MLIFNSEDGRAFLVAAIDTNPAAVWVDFYPGFDAFLFSFCP